MEFQKLIEARRSIRSYDDTKKVTEEQIRQLVEAAIQAPSWKNSQTARYYAVLSDEMRQKLAEECLPAFNIKNTHGAALVVTTFVENRSGYNKATGEPENEAGNGWGYYDMGLHNMLFVLKAKELGLDTLITGIRDAEKSARCCKFRKMSASAPSSLWDMAQRRRSSRSGRNRKKF